MKCRIKKCDNELTIPIEKNTAYCKTCLNKMHPLKYIRVTKRLTQTTMADKLLVTQSMISKIENRDLEPTLPIMFLLKRDFRINLNNFVEQCIYVKKN